MSRDQMNTWVRGHALQIAVYLVSLGVAWGVLTAEVKQVRQEVATRPSADAIERLARSIERMDERTQRIERYLCRQRPSDIGCQ